MKRLIFLLLISIFTTAVYAGVQDHAPFPHPQHSGNGQCYGYAMARAFGRDVDHLTCPATTIDVSNINTIYFGRVNEGDPGNINYTGVQIGDIIEMYEDHAVYVVGKNSSSEQGIIVDHFYPGVGVIEDVSLSTVDNGAPMYHYTKNEYWDFIVQNKFSDGSVGGMILIGKPSDLNEKTSPWPQTGVDWEAEYRIATEEDGSTVNGRIQDFIGWYFDEEFETIDEYADIEVTHGINETLTWEAKFRELFELEISGTTLLVPGGTAYFIANAIGGSGTYSNYEWWKRIDGGIVPKGNDPKAPAPGIWTYLPWAEGQDTIETGDWQSFSLKCRVTDSENKYVEDIHSVTVEPGKISLPKQSTNNNDESSALNSLGVSEKFMLFNNYPNPFNPSTAFKFSLPEDSNINFSIYSVSGQKILILAEGNFSKGYHEISWNGKNQKGNTVSNGIYIYELRAGNQRFINKMVFTK